jgi:hypothetical protein
MWNHLPISKQTGWLHESQLAKATNTVFALVSLRHSYSDILITDAPGPFIFGWKNHSSQCLHQRAPCFHVLRLPIAWACPKRFPLNCCHCLGVGRAALRRFPPHSRHLPCAPNPPSFPQRQESAADTSSTLPTLVPLLLLLWVLPQHFALPGPAPPFPASMARTRHMTAKARSTATNSSPPRPPPTSVADQGRDAVSTPQQARVAVPDPLAMGGSPSMMQRFFPTGLPRRYTRQDAAVPLSIGSVISSSQERYGNFSPRHVTSLCEARRGLGVRWPGAGKDEEDGGTALQLAHRDRHVAQSLPLRNSCSLPCHCSRKQVLCDHFHGFSPAQGPKSQDS